MTRILLLGGTTEASRMAEALAKAGIPAIFSYAGRTAAPVAQPLPMRIGGFGGAEGLAAFLRREAITTVIDATHPFAAQISRNAIAACDAAGMPLLALERPAWAVDPGWLRVPDVQSAALALPPEPSRVFLAIGRQNLEPFAAHPHAYLLRLVDPPEALPLRADHVVARGPFTVLGDLALLRDWRAHIVVAKNAGGAGAEAKITAARQLGLSVILIDRPVLPPRRVVRTVEEALHSIPLGV
ncbi:cobalt-precorrin-6A reductase [Cereibacter sp. SYSU M97828]|nr:cobalt-precorrin-6A reductase [Cereibacter flavus]